jgi:recombinational DNA repair protein (RecF pathway)
MSYHIYSTDGIVLKRTPHGEANIVVHILTRDLGLIIASAQSARLQSSKLSSALTEYSLMSLSVIKAKRGWKITDARSKENFYFSCSIVEQRMLARISSVLLQMIPGEDPHHEIFETVLSSFTFLQTVVDFNVKNFETVAVLRILYHLGYVIKNSDTEAFLGDTTSWTQSLVASAATHRTTLIKIINHALKESHL